MNNIIFLGGAHATGKTQLCREIYSHCGIEHLSASRLILDYKREEFPKDKRIEDIDGNQDILLEALKKQNLSGDKLYVLDGHFCLFDKYGKVTKVPMRVFDELNPKLMILLEGDVSEIQRRLLNRDGQYFDKGLLKNLQKTEINYAKVVAEKLESQLVIHDISKDVNYILKSVNDFKSRFQKQNDFGRDLF